MVVPFPRAYAATQGLFLFDNLRQRVEFDYQYRALTLSESESKSTRSVRHRFEETYLANISYALRSPNLLFGGASFETKWDQLESSVSSGTTKNKSSAGGTRFLYDVYGTFLRYSPISFNFFSNTKMHHVSRDFARSYDQNILSNGLSMRVRSLMIPFNVEYRQTTIETDGLLSDYDREDESLMIDARHSVAQFSKTFLDLRFDEYRTTYSNDLDRYELLSSRFLLTNDLTWHSGKNIRKLYSRVNYKEEAGSSVLNGYDWSESLDWHFGRALLGKLNFNQIHTDRVLSELERTQGRASIQHQFLECVDTQVGLERRQTIQNDGSEDDRSGDFSLAYRNKLSWGSYLHTNYYQRYGIVDRAFSSSLQTVLDEPHTADTIVPIILDRLNVLSTTIVIRNADPAVRIDPYVRDLDYQLDQVGETTLISILPGSDMVDGTGVLVDYSHLANTQEEYEYSNRRISASLTFVNRSRLYGRWEETARKNLSGEDSFATSSGDSTEAVLGLDGFWQRSTFGFEYKKRETHYEDRQSLEAFYQWPKRIAKGVLTTGLGNYYATIKPAASDNDYWINTFSINAKYQTPVYRRGSLSTFSKYVNTRSDVQTRDDISLGLVYRHGYGKFLMSIDTRVDWRFIGEQDRREERVNFKVSRYL